VKPQDVSASPKKKMDTTNISFWVDLC
jgi:hypothetical protein